MPPPSPVASHGAARAGPTRWAGAMIHPPHDLSMVGEHRDAEVTIVPTERRTAITPRRTVGLEKPAGAGHQHPPPLQSLKLDLRGHPTR